MPKITVSLGGAPEGEYAVDEPVVVVGRDASCQIRIDNLGISRTHCQLIRRTDGYLLQDMGSANGTYVNGKRVEEHHLKEGDEILLGKYTLKFSCADAEAAPKHSKTDMVDMGDVIHTYVMDGEKIRERLGQMHAAGGPPEDQPADKSPPAPGTPTPKPEPAASPAAAGPRRAMDHALDFDPLKPQTPTRARPSAGTQRHTKPGGGGLSLLLYLSFAINFLLIIIVLGALIFWLLKTHGQKEEPTTPQPPATTSPAPTHPPAETTPGPPPEQAE